MQLVGQSTSTPFMSGQEGYYNNEWTVSFDTQDVLDNKKAKFISMMKTLWTKGSNYNRSFSPKIYQNKRRRRKRLE